MQRKVSHILDGLAATVSFWSSESAMPTREELEMRLDALQEQLPKLSADEDADFDYLDFQARAEAIISSATQDDAAYVRTRIDGMLAGAGLIPSDDAGHSCG
ncbi:TPA: hypothetical protein HH295_07705 [Xanthomonas vasicola pv. zeae]|uniref:Uncharacterized protein n=2 Tax=Xanthomonas vasicola pv. vasculorum TaxID=325776 RepID=A0A836P567_XANVA|nr:hypothetical protein [Xanthomonas vasicola]KFA24835.1 hypothetical protein KWS_0120240 [Xanthomonas vasicola pv. musacearum NCPPB 4384]AVQ06583.1 hypothetical protein C7V42_08125 [Xanthomonas vasicola pv. vasculorum]AZM70783.1 hypothetical protein CXP37_08140 [Xanthomonas vasicola pv. vasculorum]AZR26203.1 hypothetical protein NX80_006540 [Xanthomonas vasicola pv. arecae]AZR31519.1 hypothetical protein KWO_014300 [Xanthomonas vasicola pv. musacearum NCPPB 4379]